jgi:DNA-binding transcriptional regulator GbsR (MarR family)
MTSNPANTAIECFIERIGLSLEADGLPRIAGRIMGFFVIHGGPVSFTELAERLQVSRGSVSTNSRLLASLGVIDRISLPGDRQDYYQLSERPYVRLIEGYIKRQQDMETVVQDVQGKLPTSMKATRTRLRDLHAFYTTAAEQLQILVKKIESQS